MQKFFLLPLIGWLSLALPTCLVAQPETQTEVETTMDLPLDGITEKITLEERKVLAYQPVREADILWEKRIWRVIDVREKMNQAFTYPNDPFFQIIADAAVSGDLRVFDTNSDKFEKVLTKDEVDGLLNTIDTVLIYDPEDFEETYRIVKNSLNWEDVKRFRIKEDWFFDAKTSSMQVRILGIAPMKEVFDSEGNFRYEMPMFWVYYPEARELLAKHRIFNAAENNNAAISWEDAFEMRYFSSYIYKESNISDRRLGDYLTGVDLLMEADKIKNEIFNLEQDMWQY